MLAPVIKKNDQQANIIIGLFSVIVFVAVTFLSKFTINVELPFDKHIFALINALLNTTVAFLLVLGLVTVKQKKYQLHKSIMLLALLLSVLFLVSYICHHLFAGETAFGEIDGIKGLSESEMAAVGSTRSIYLLILLTHIPLAGLVLPFILLAAYRALTGEFAQHKKLVRYVWPIWFYVAVTGPVVYWFIAPYYA